MANSDNPPIDPPSQPLEYRAIGLIQGRYVPKEENSGQGTLFASDGVELKAFMAWLQPYAEKYLDLNQEQLWVVYPRRHPTKATMSVQLKGFRQAQPGEPLPTGDGYFSIRGEVVQREDKVGFVVVKIRRNRTDPSKAKEMLIRLEGFVPPEAVGQFCEFECERDGHDLVIIDGKPIAALNPPETRKQVNKPRPRLPRGVQPPRTRPNGPSAPRGRQGSQHLERK